MIVKGKAHRVGDRIDTDAMISGKYTKSLDFNEMKRHTFEDLLPGFADRCSEGDFIIAGTDFGIGSSREQAPFVLSLCGIRCIAAKSFARIFYRNAINIGISLLQLDTDGISDGDALEYNTADGVLINHTTGERYQAMRLPRIMQRILEDGGIVNTVSKMCENGPDISFDADEA